MRTPERGDSMGYGTRICSSRSFPKGGVANEDGDRSSCQYLQRGRERKRGWGVEGTRGGDEL